MFRRNFDFFALTVVLAGFVVIQNLPLAGVRVLTSAGYHKTVSVNKCNLQRVVARLADFRSE